jgi:hypothetical protein
LPSDGALVGLAVPTQQTMFKKSYHNMKFKIIN